MTIDNIINKMETITGNNLKKAELKAAYNNWVNETGLTKFDAVITLDSMPPQMGLALLKIHHKTTEMPEKTKNKKDSKMNKVDKKNDIKTVICSVSPSQEGRQGGYSMVGFYKKKLVLIHDIDIAISNEGKALLLKKGSAEIHIFKEGSIYHAVINAENIDNAKYELQLNNQAYKKKLGSSQQTKDVLKVEVEEVEEVEEVVTQIVDSSKIGKWLNNGWEIDTSKIVLKRIS